MYWWQWTLFGVGIELAVSLIITIKHRSRDIYNNKNTNWDRELMNLLWPLGLIVLGIPHIFVEYPSQLIAKYMEYKRRKKFSVNKAA